MAVEPLARRAVMQSLDTLAFAAPRPLFQLPATYVTAYAYDVSCDGQRFLVIAPLRRAPPEPLTLVVNSSAALRR
jgi:hypothetical protein